jgi:hypothetical protein
MSLQYDWMWQHFKPVSKELDKKCKQLEDLFTCSDATSAEAKKKILAEMDELLYREELLWMQRLRIAWLRVGDRNTHFFHRKVTWRWKKKYQSFADHMVPRLRTRRKLVT